MEDFNYKCPKCGNIQCDTGQIRAAGGFWGKIFDVQTRKFTSVSCTNCRYTEFYQADSSKLGSLFDLFTN